MIAHRAIPWARETKGATVKLARTFVLSGIAGVLSLGLVSVTAPGAHADSSWGMGRATHTSTSTGR